MQRAERPSFVRLALAAHLRVPQRAASSRHPGCSARPHARAQRGRVTYFAALANAAGVCFPFATGTRGLNSTVARRQPPSDTARTQRLCPVYHFTVAEDKITESPLAARFLSAQRPRLGAKARACAERKGLETAMAARSATVHVSQPSPGSARPPVAPRLPRATSSDEVRPAGALRPAAQTATPDAKRETDSSERSLPLPATHTQWWRCFRDCFCAARQTRARRSTPFSPLWRRSGR
jgi:hypothetical protein